MQDITVERIKKLLKRIESKEVDVAQIEESSGVSKMVISKLRTGKTDIEKMQLKTALALSNLERSLEFSEIGDHRSAIFGQLWGLIDAVNSLSDKFRIIQQGDQQAFVRRPMTIFTRLHARMIDLEPQIFLKCSNQLGMIFMQFDNDEYNDNPIDNRYILVANAKKMEIIEELTTE